MVLQGNEWENQRTICDCHVHIGGKALNVGRHPLFVVARSKNWTPDQH